MVEFLVLRQLGQPATSYFLRERLWLQLGDVLYVPLKSMPYHIVMIPLPQPATQVLPLPVVRALKNVLAGVVKQGTAPLCRFIQELLGNGVCRGHRTVKWSRGTRFIRPGNIGGNHLRRLIPFVSVSCYAVHQPLARRAAYPDRSGKGTLNTGLQF